MARLSFAAVLVVLALPSIADAQCPVPGFKYAAFGDQSVDASGGGTVQSYDSSAGVFTPTCAGGNVGTNSITSATVKISGGSDVCGNVEFGAGGSSSTVVVVNGSGSSIAGSTSCTSSSCTSLTTNLSLTAVNVPTLTIASPASVSSATIDLASGKSYTSIDCSNTTGATLTLNAGTYVIDSLIVRGKCELKVASGPVSVFVKSTLDLGGSTTNPSFKATDLVFYGADTLTTVSINSAGTSVSFALYAPQADITVNGNADMWGALVGKTVKLNGGGKINYDKALGAMNSAALTCAGTEVSRATPIVATINGQTTVVQGSFEAATGAATTIASVADVANFKFPHLEGHMRARLADGTGSAIGTTAKSFSDTSVTTVFDAANGIPARSTDASGCALNGSGAFLSTCRNVFTNSNSTSTNGTTFHPTTMVFSDNNAATIGPLIVPTSVVTLTTAQHQTVLQRVQQGTLAGTVAKLGGVDRSTVAVIGASTLAGNSARPAMAYFGGTDGMLHAVCASIGGTTASSTSICPSLGAELWAFVPRVQLPLIRTNTARIDGSPRVVDVFGDFTNNPATGTKSWRTILTFQTGFSSSVTKPAVYTFDVTDPAKPVLLWEYITPGTVTTNELGVGLAMHAGSSLVNGVISNLAIAQTNNGGSGANGFVVNALSLETGSRAWKFSYDYPTPPRGVGADGTPGIPPTGVPGGAVGLDLSGATGFTTDVVMGDLYGNLWRLDAGTGTSSTGSATSPLFSFSTNKHPIGALPAIIDNGAKVAVFGTGAYADTSTTSTAWTTASQSLIGVKLSPTTSINESSATLAINRALTSGEKVSSSVLVVGTQVFFLTDNSDINAASYGTTGAATGHAYGLDYITTGSTIVAVGSGTQGGASGLANNGTSLYGGSSDKAQRLASNATTTAGTSVDTYGNGKASRLVWVQARQ